MNWRLSHRPGYFGRRRDEIVRELTARFGEGRWDLRWVPNDPANVPGRPMTEVGQAYYFFEACVAFYEESYFRYLQGRPDDVRYITEFIECYDNAPSNIQSGFDYRVQESYSTHIQDIAVRNALRRLGQSFRGTNGGYMQIRSSDTAGYRFGPGNVPFYDPGLITQPSLKPSWANAGSVEDFWQSCKWVVVAS